MRVQLNSDGEIHCIPGLCDTLAPVLKNPDTDLFVSLQGFCSQQEILRSAHAFIDTFECLRNDLPDLPPKASDQASTSYCFPGSKTRSPWQNTAHPSTWSLLETSIQPGSNRRAPSSVAELEGCSQREACSGRLSDASTPSQTQGTLAV